MDVCVCVVCMALVFLSLLFTFARVLCMCTCTRNSATWDRLAGKHCDDSLVALSSPLTLIPVSPPRHFLGCRRRVRIPTRSRTSVIPQDETPKKNRVIVIAAAVLSPRKRGGGVIVLSLSERGGVAQRRQIQKRTANHSAKKSCAR